MFRGVCNGTHITNEHQKRKGHSKHGQSPPDEIPSSSSAIPPPQANLIELDTPISKLLSPTTITTMKWILFNVEANRYACPRLLFLPKVITHYIFPSLSTKHVYLMHLYIFYQKTLAHSPLGYKYTCGSGILSIFLLGLFIILRKIIIKMNQPPLLQ
jgi:hypothetical protein